MKNKLLVGFLVYIIIGLNSCDHDCGRPSPNKYKTVGLDWYNYKATYSENTDSQLVLTKIENDSVDYNEYSILIEPKHEFYFTTKSKKWNFSL